jgi:hypothetical protein
MARLLDEPWLARRLADEGRRRVAERFNMSQTVDQLARLLGDAVERAAA